MNKIMNKVPVIAVILILFGFLAYTIKLEKDCEETVFRYLSWLSDDNSKIDRLEKELSLIRPPRLLSMERIVGKTILNFAVDSTQLNQNFIFVHLPFKSQKFTKLTKEIMSF